MLAAIGCPMIDHITHVPEEIFKKYQLPSNGNAIYTPHLKPLVDEIKLMDYCKKPGGSITNTIRVYNWLTDQEKHKPIYCGAIGKDSSGKTISQLLQEENIETLFTEKLEPTATCFALVSGSNRFLLTNLAAAKLFHLSDFNSMIETLQKYTFLYLSCLFLNVSVDVSKKAVDLFFKDDKKIIVNLGAPNLFNKYFSESLYILNRADVIVGNKEEFESLVRNVTSDDLIDGDILEKLLEFLENGNGKIVIMTNGPGAVIVMNGGKMKTFPVPGLNESLIRDTNGAGDAFTGGFLSQYVQDRSLEESIKCGIWASLEILKHIGCDFDKSMKYTKRI